MPWQPLTIHAFPGIRDKPQLNLNPLLDSFCKPKFRTVPDVSGPVEGMLPQVACVFAGVLLDEVSRWGSQLLPVGGLYLALETSQIKF